MSNCRNFSHLAADDNYIKAALQLLEGELKEAPRIFEADSTKSRAGMNINSIEELQQITSTHIVLLFAYTGGFESEERKLVESLQSTVFPYISQLLSAKEVVLCYSKKGDTALEMSEIGIYLKENNLNLNGCFLLVNGRVQDYERVRWYNRFTGTEYIKAARKLIERSTSNGIT